MHETVNGTRLRDDGDAPGSIPDNRRIPLDISAQSDIRKLPLPAFKKFCSCQTNAKRPQPRYPLPDHPMTNSSLSAGASVSGVTVTALVVPL